MSTIEVNKITPVSGGTTVQVGESGDTINIPAGATIANAGTSTGFGDSLRPNAQPLIINGDMAIFQRATSVTGWNAVGYTTVDRFKTVCEIGTYTIIQESLTSGNAFADGFKNALRMDCTTATASGSAGDQTTFEYRMEGFDTLAFKKGTANAQKSTLAFWVKASKTGSNLQVNLRDNTNDRQVGGTYSISSADTWEHKVINFPADTTGALADANTAELIIEWWLDGGSNYSGGAVPTSWEAKDNADRNVTNFDLGGSTSNDWAITGVQFEVGEYSASTLPPYQFESYGDNLIRCQRYYEKSFEQGTTPTAGTSAPDGRVFASWDGASARTQIDFNTTKRASPTVTIYRGANAGSGTSTGTANFIMELGGGGSANWYNHTCTSNHADDSQVSLTGSTSNFVANGGYVADLNFTADAEL